MLILPPPSWLAPCDPSPPPIHCSLLQDLCSNVISFSFLNTLYLIVLLTLLQLYLHYLLLPDIINILIHFFVGCLYWLSPLHRNIEWAETVLCTAPSLGLRLASATCLMLNECLLNKWKDENYLESSEVWELEGDLEGFPSDLAANIGWASITTFHTGKIHYPAGKHQIHFQAAHETIQQQIPNPFLSQNGLVWAFETRGWVFPHWQHPLVHSLRGLHLGLPPLYVCQFFHVFFVLNGSTKNHQNRIRYPRNVAWDM